jgi:hypothetical protein
MLYYIPITILLAAIDAFRIKIMFGKVGNINHWVSYGLSSLGIAGLYFIVKPQGWHIVNFILGCIAIRALVFDIALNLFRREKIDYVSTSTNAATETLLNIPFFEKKLIAFVFLAVCIATNYFWL